MVRWLLDLAVIVLLTVLAGAGMVTFDGPVRVALVLPLIVFVPGYALLSALFPEESKLARSRRGRRPWGSPSRGDQTDEDDFLLGNIERLVLSVAISLAVVAFIVFGLNFTVGFDERRIAIMLFGFTGSMIIFAIARRIVLPPEERFTIEITTEGIPSDPLFIGLFGISLLVLIASVGAFAMMDPAEDPNTPPGIGAIAENETTNNMTWEAAEERIINGQPVTLVVQNNEERQQQYTVVVARDGEVSDTFTPTVDAHSEQRIDYENVPSSGEKLQLFVYEGERGELSRESADAFARYPLGGGGDGGGNETDGSLAPPAVSIVGSH